MLHTQILDSCLEQFGITAAFWIYSLKHYTEAVVCAFCQLKLLIIVILTAIIVPQNLGSRAKNL